MNVFILDSFREALERLDGRSKSLSKQAAANILLNPVSPGGQMHRLDKAKDRDFWSYRVNDDVRMILHMRGDSCAICYVDRHDPAYRWAERRKMEVHPRTGAAQIVETRERVEEVVTRIVREVEDERRLFENCDRDYLFDLGVPTEWLDAVLLVTSSGFDTLKTHLPEEAFERLFAIACGIPVPRPAAVAGADPFLHPDAQRRFRSFGSGDELRQALEAPWERWRLFLHPVQREVVERRFNGPARVTGGAGTGKTVVALHRARELARRYPESRILLTTFSRTLASRLGQNADLLMGDGPERRQITVTHLHKLAHEYWTESCSGRFSPLSKRKLQELIRDARTAAGAKSFTLGFLRAEWEAIVDNLGIHTWDEYRTVSRAGRGTALGLKQRKELWGIFERVRRDAEALGLMTWNDLCLRTRKALERRPAPFNHVIADESQDFGPCELALLRSLAAQGPDDLLLCGDVGQRIYKGKTSWLNSGIDVRGRSTQLRVNYRTTEQIREFADSLLPGSLSDGDGAIEERRTISLLRGPTPEVRVGSSERDEEKAVADWIRRMRAAAIDAHQIALFGRSTNVLEQRIEPAVAASGERSQRLSDETGVESGLVAVGTMHRAKGLEFKAVAVLGCDLDLLPLKTALDELEDAADRASFEESERQLLYVACTRAREQLLVTTVGEPSVFLTAQWRSE